MVFRSFYRGSKAQDEPSANSDDQEAVIAVMGATGSGKSTFINLVSKSSLSVSRGLRSCTNSVQLGEAFNLDGRRVVLIDTPGFDDTTRSDTEVLSMIAAFLTTSYERDYKLTGLLYFHRISDFRMGGVSARNIGMLRSLCGDDSLKNVVIVTNMWGQVEAGIGDERELELKSDELFFKPLLENDAQITRHTNDLASAKAIIRRVFRNDPLPLCIQKEMVDNQMSLTQTSAAKKLNQEMESQIMEYQERVDRLEKAITRMQKEKEEREQVIEEERKLAAKKIAEIRKKAEEMEPSYKAEKKRLEALVEQIQNQIAEEKAKSEPPKKGLKAARGKSRSRFSDFFSFLRIFNR